MTAGPAIQGQDTNAAPPGSVPRLNVVTIAWSILVVATIALLVGRWREASQVTVCGPPPPAASASPTSGRLPVAAQEALLRLTDKAPAEVLLGADGGFEHSHLGADPVTALAPGDRRLLDQQLDCARRAAKGLVTPEQALAAGYVQGSTLTLGVGDHWIDWTAVGRPFDPAHPAMLLFASRRYDAPEELVGFSYWVGSSGPPAGFAGPDDHWHRHVGLCFEDGWLTRQSVTKKADCPGAFIAGTDLWMLHAWVVDGTPSRWGMFSVLNPSLCAAPRTTPDVLRCNPGQR